MGSPKLAWARDKKRSLVFRYIVNRFLYPNNLDDSQNTALDVTKHPDRVSLVLVKACSDLRNSLHKTQ